MGYPCHIITATPQAENCPADIHFVRDDLQGIWERDSRRRRSFRAYLELLIRQMIFPGHLGILWSQKAAAQCRKIVSEHPNDRFVLFATYPPMGALLAALMVGRGKKIPWIADFRDPLSALIVEGEPRYRQFWARRLEKRVFRSASAVIANTEPAATVWGERYPWARQKLRVLYNGFDLEDAPSARPVPPRSHKLIVHSGSFYHGRTPNIVIGALARLRQQNAAEALSAKILLLGSTASFAGADRALYEQAQREGWLEFRTTLHRRDALVITEEADALLLFQGHSRLQVPGKLYEYICIGRPVLALLLRPSPVEPILQNAAVPHVCIYTDDAPEVADRKLLEFLRLPNTAVPINDWFRDNFNSKVQTEALARIIDAVAR